MKRYVIFNHPIARIGFEQRESDDGEWVKYSDAIEAVKAEREAWIIKMLSIRDIAYEMEQDEVADEVYHFVYSLADSTFKNSKPWEEWEAIRARGK